MLKTLTLEELLIIEHEFCRVKCRETYWHMRGGERVENSQGAVGRLVKVVKDRRNKFHRQRGEEDLKSKDLAQFVGVPASRLSEFFSGKPSGNERWIEIGYRAIKFILTGDVAENLITPEQHQCRERILKLFFPKGAQESQVDDRIRGTFDDPDRRLFLQPWYFSPAIRNSTSKPESILETEAELRAFKGHVARERLKDHHYDRFRLVRVSATGHFRQVEEDCESLTVNGLICVDLLLLDVPMIFVVADCGNEDFELKSHNSANAFKKLAVEHIQREFPEKSNTTQRAKLDRLITILKLDPKQFGRATGGDEVRFAFEYFARDLRWQFYDRDENEKYLIVSRDSSIVSPGAYAPEGNEIESFIEWLKVFVDPVVGY